MYTHHVETISLFTDQFTGNELEVSSKLEQMFENF